VEQNNAPPSDEEPQTTMHSEKEWSKCTHNCL
jgi:hypothetical protein